VNQRSLSIPGLNLSKNFAIPHSPCEPGCSYLHNIVKTNKPHFFTFKEQRKGLGNHECLEAYSGMRGISYFCFP
jgi:hypothetical protein